MVDVGERSASILALYEGHAVLDAATLVLFTGGEAGGSDARCDGFFDLSLLEDGESGGLKVASVGLHEALLRTVALADSSLRGELLDNIVLMCELRASNLYKLDRVHTYYLPMTVDPH